LRISRFLSIATFVTCLSLLYVWQQTEIFRFAYTGQKKLVLYQDLLDKNNFLRYNIKKQASLVQIGSKISKYSDFQMPDTYRLVRVAPVGKGVRLAQKPAPAGTILSRFFSIKQEAQARTINP